MYLRNIGIGRDASDDLKDIDKIWNLYYKNKFNLPNLNYTVSHGIVEDGQGIIGFGEVKLFAEAIMILDGSRSIRTKAMAMKAMIYKALADSKSIGLSQLHISVADNKFAEQLEKRYGFKKVENIIMVRNL